MNSNTFIIGLAIFTAVFVVLQKRRNVQLPQHKWSELWCIFWGLLGIGGLVSGLIQYHNAATQCHLTVLQAAFAKKFPLVFLVARCHS